MKVFPFSTRQTTGYCIPLGFQDETEQIALKMCGFASRNKRTCHIYHVPIDPRTCVDQDKLPAPDFPARRRKMHHSCVGSRTHDRRITNAVGSIAAKFSFELNLQRSFADTRSNETPNRGKTIRSSGGGASEET